MLPHKHYEEAKFIEGSQKLKARFGLNAPDTLFVTTEQKIVPVDGLPTFIE